MANYAREQQEKTTSARLVEPAGELYREIFTHSNDAIAIIDLDGRYIEQNAAHRHLIGFSDEELFSQTTALHMDAETFALVERDLIEKGEYRGEITSRAKDGKALQIELSAFAMKDASGTPICYVGIERDITDRKRTEKRLALQYAVTSALSESTDVADGAQQILRAVCENLGWQVGVLWLVERESERLTCINVWHADDVPDDAFELACRETKFAKGIGLPGRIWASGEPAWIANVLEDNNFPRAPIAATAGLRGAFGFPILLGREVIGTIEFFSREIRQPDPQLLQMVASIGGQIGQFQERKRAEGELAKLLLLERSARAEAEQANRLKDEFLATVSHELRTPLNAMMGWARMLRSGRLDAESRDHALEVIERNAWAQKQIIEDILDVSRVITGKLHLNLSPVDLRTVADAALDTVRPALEAKEIQIKRTMDPSIRVIAGDSDRLQQVIWNLLSNAAKFTPAGGQIELSVQHENTHIKIQVGDTGSGIDPDFLPYVFERFRQADGSTTRTHGGLGLGLAIVRHLVELHGGSIKAENRKEGQGAILTVSLPLPSGELHVEDVPAAFVRDGDSSTEIPNLEGCRILVVDDDADARDLIAIDLTACGANVSSFARANEALEAFAQSEFDLLISDIGMPECDGYEFIRSVRAQETAEQRRKTPAIALTSYARVQDRLRALIAGYDTHVAKPLERGELVTVVASLAGRLVKK